MNLDQQAISYSKNETMENFSVKYWRNIDDKEYLLKILAEERKKAVEQYELAVRDRDEKIAKRIQRIEKLSKKSL